MGEVRFEEIVNVGWKVVSRIKVLLGEIDNLGVAFYPSGVWLSASELRAIADKLDELNGMSELEKRKQRIRDVTKHINENY